jgi:anti-sigma factor RsiW
MSWCDEQLLGAYHDGELAADDRARVERHLGACPACARVLEQLRDGSRRLRQYPFQDLTPAELRELHQAIDDAAGSDADGRRIWRIGGSVGLIAASILVVGVTWFNVLPARPSPPPGSGDRTAPAPAAEAIATAPGQEWQRMAMTLHPDPLRTDADGPTYAMGDADPAGAVPRYDAGLADYMVEGLGQRVVP